MAELSTDYNAQDAARIANKALAASTNQGRLVAVDVNYTNSTGGTIAANSVIDFGPVLHLGKVIQINYKTDAHGSSRTFDLGHQEYTSSEDGSTVAAVIDAFVDGLDVSGAASGVLVPADGLGVELTGKANLLGKLLGGTMADGDGIDFTLIIKQNH